MRQVVLAMRQVFLAPQRERKADINHHRQADDLRRRLEVAEDAGVARASEDSRARSGFDPTFHLILAAIGSDSTGIPNLISA